MSKKSQINQEAAKLLKLTANRPLGKDELNTVNRSSYRRLTKFHYSKEDEIHLKEFDFSKYANSNLEHFKCKDSSLNFFPFYTISKPLFEEDIPKPEYGVLYQLNELPIGHFKSGFGKKRKRKAILIENLENFIHFEHYRHKFDFIEQYDVIYTRGTNFYDIGYYKEVICFFDWDFAGLEYYLRLKRKNINCSFYIDDDYLDQAYHTKLKTKVNKILDTELMCENAKLVYQEFYLKGYKVFQESFLLINEKPESPLYSIDRIKNSIIEAKNKGLISKKELIVMQPNGEEKYLLIDRKNINKTISESYDERKVILINDIGQYVWLTRYFREFNNFNPHDYAIIYTNTGIINYKDNSKVRLIEDWYITALYRYFICGKNIPHIDYFLSLKSYSNVKSKSLNKLIKIADTIENEDHKDLLKYIIQQS